MSNLDTLGAVHNVGSLDTSQYQDQRNKEQLTRAAIKSSADSSEVVPDQKDPKATREELESYVSALNELGSKKPPHLEFNIDDDTGKTVIKMTHRDSGELVRQIPSEEFMRIARMVKDSESLNDHPGQWVEIEA